MTTWAQPSKAFKRRNGWVILLFTLLTIGIYALYWLYCLHRELPARQGKDMSGRLWILVFITLTLLMMMLFYLSGFETSWQHWSNADTIKQTLFLLALVVAVTLNIWFMIGTERLTDRVHQLLTHQPPVIVSAGKKCLLFFGVLCQMVMMILPTLDAAQLIILPEYALSSLEIYAKTGTGSLFAWAITLHRDTLSLQLPKAQHTS